METENIQKLVTEFFEKLQLQISQIEVVKEQEGIYFIKVQSNDSGIIIWPKWRNLEDIKSLLKSMLVHLLWKNIIIHIEINDYLQAKEEKLLVYVKSKIDLVEKTWKDFRLPFLSSYDRKKVHAYVAELNNTKIYTKSMGEGPERRLHICKKDEKMTIDAEWSDI